MTLLFRFIGRWVFITLGGRGCGGVSLGLMQLPVGFHATLQSRLRQCIPDDPEDTQGLTLQCGRGWDQPDGR